MKIWKVLHFAFALTLPVALLLLMSCKQAHETHADLGPQFDSSQLDQILGGVVSAAHVENLQKGQMVHYEESLRVNNQDPDILESVNDVSVIDRSVDSDTQTTRITTHHSANSLGSDGKTWEDMETEDTIEIPTAGIASSGLLASVGAKLAQLTNTPQPTRITYHNLRTSEGDADVPAKGQTRGNCANVPNCKIHVTYLSYDEVLWSDDQHYTKKSYDFELTSGLPFMETNLYGIMTLGCVGMFQTYNGRNYYFRDCQYLSDLQM